MTAASAKRSIEVETDVYAAIWADRRAGEDSEDEILTRKYGVERSKLLPVAMSDRVGWADPRYGVSLKEGQQIFGTYKGREYRAVATDGCLVRLDNEVRYNSLNQLSRSIHSNVENAWNKLLARADDQRQLIAALRK